MFPYTLNQREQILLVLHNKVDGAESGVNWYALPAVEGVFHFLVGATDPLLNVFKDGVPVLEEGVGETAKNYSRDVGERTLSLSL